MEIFGTRPKKKNQTPWSFTVDFYQCWMGIDEILFSKLDQSITMAIAIKEIISFSCFLEKRMANFSPLLLF